jgi:hypothetical protein
LASSGGEILGSWGWAIESIRQRNRRFVRANQSNQPIHEKHDADERQL